MNKKNLIIILISVILLAVIGDFLLHKQPAPKLETVETNEKSIHHLKIKTMQGEHIAVSSLKEDVILLHFWTSWCHTCAQELPTLIELVKRYKGKIALISVSIDDSEEMLKRFITKFEQAYNISFDVPNTYWVWDKNKSLSINEFSVIRVPETYIINTNRKIVKKHIGVIDWEDKAINSSLEALIKK